MKTVTQFSIFMVNKPGTLAKVIEDIANAKINIVAITITDSHEHGVLRLIPGNIEKLRELLKKLNHNFSENEVLALTLPNRTGVLAEVFSQLGDSHVNIHYAYASSGAPGGKTTCVLSSNDNNKAAKLLSKLETNMGRRKNAKVGVKKGRKGRK